MTVARAVVQRLRAVFRRSPWAADLGSSLTAVLWAVVSFMGPDMKVWVSMTTMLEIWPQETWQALAFCCGCAQFVFMTLDLRWARWGMATLASWFWGLLALGIWTATPWNPVAVAYAGWCAINVFSMLRLLRPDRVI